MAIRPASCLCLLIYLHLFVSGIAFDEKPVGDIHILRVGEELQQEIMPFKKGHCLYLLHGLKSPLRHEVKISYPASQGDDRLGMSLTRRLFNAEKLIFEAEANYLVGDNTYILVTVEPAGIVASPNVSEREFVLFNIVCNELLAGIPYKAWWVGILALLCIGFAPLSSDNSRFPLLSIGLIAVIFSGDYFIPSIWDALQFTGATAAVSVGFIFLAAITLRLGRGTLSF